MGAGAGSNRLTSKRTERRRLARRAPCSGSSRDGRAGPALVAPSQRLSGLPANGRSSGSLRCRAARPFRCGWRQRPDLALPGRLVRRVPAWSASPQGSGAKMDTHGAQLSARGRYRAWRVAWRASAVVVTPADCAAPFPRKRCGVSRSNEPSDAAMHCGVCASVHPFGTVAEAGLQHQNIRAVRIVHFAAHSAASALPARSHFTSLGRAAGLGRGPTERENGAGRAASELPGSTSRRAGQWLRDLSS